MDNKIYELNDQSLEGVSGGAAEDVLSGGIINHGVYKRVFGGMVELFFIWRERYTDSFYSDYASYFSDTGARDDYRQDFCVGTGDLQGMDYVGISDQETFWAATNIHDLGLGL